MAVMSPLRCAVCLAAAPTIACAGALPSEPESAAGVVPHPTPPAQPWANLSLGERKAHMNERVVPVMEAHFRRHDPVRYARFSCDTCHGSDMAERGFKMPNPALLALHPTGSEEQHRMVDTYPEMVKLMFNHVLPDMVTLLGAQPYDATTGAGVTCYACHPAADSTQGAAR